MLTVFQDLTMSSIIAEPYCKVVHCCPLNFVKYVSYQT